MCGGRNTAPKDLHHVEKAGDLQKSIPKPGQDKGEEARNNEREDMEIVNINMFSAVGDNVFYPTQDNPCGRTR